MSVAIGEAESKGLDQVVEFVSLGDRRPNVDAGRHHPQALTERPRLDMSLRCDDLAAFRPKAVERDRVAGSWYGPFG